MSPLEHEAEPVDDVTAYASAVVAGEIVAGPYGSDGVLAASAGSADRRRARPAVRSKRRARVIGFFAKI
jgi:hypothetical protein